MRLCAFVDEKVLLLLIMKHGILFHFFILVKNKYFSCLYFLITISNLESTHSQYLNTLHDTREFIIDKSFIANERSLSQRA